MNPHEEHVELVDSSTNTNKVSVQQTSAAGALPVVIAEDVPASNRKRSVTRWVPRNDTQLLALAERVIQFCPAEYFPPTYCTLERFRTLTEDYDTTYMNKRNVSSNRPITSMSIEDLELEMQKQAETVKSYLHEIFGKRESRVHYPVFGLKHNGRAFKLDTGRSAMESGVGQLIVALDEYGFSDRKYGTAFWTACLERYRALTSKSVDEASEISAHVIVKRKVRTEIEQVLHSVIHIVQGYHPANYESYLRMFGFRRV